MSQVDPITVLEYMRDCATDYSSRTGKALPKNGDLVDFLAIAFAENVGRNPSSYLYDDRSNTAGNTPPSTDRGMWMLNSYWWKDVDDTCAYDWKCATRKVCEKTQGFTTSKTQWSAYGNGDANAPFRTHLPIAWAFMRLMIARDREKASLADAADVKAKLDQRDATIAQQQADLDAATTQLTAEKNANTSLTSRLAEAEALIDTLEGKIRMAKEALA